MAAWVASLGIDRLWLTETGAAPLPFVSLAVATALHAAWILPTFRLDSPALIGLTWLTSVWACRAGLVAAGFSASTLPAFALEAIALSLALNAGERTPWGDRLARWRRARQRITTELRMSEGLMPWLGWSVRRLFVGSPERPTASAGFDRMVAELADAEQRLQSRVAELALPEEIRQRMLASAQALVARAEQATGQVAIGLEQQALEEAAGCCDRILRLQEIPSAKREALAHECEALMLGLVGHSAVRRRAPVQASPSDRAAVA